MGILLAIDDILARVERWAVVLIFSALIGMIVVNILARNLVHQSFEMLFELAPVMVLWLALLGASLALKSGRHIKLEILLRFCPPKVRKFAHGAASLFGVAVMATLLVASLSFFKEELVLFGPKGWLSLISPIFFALMVLRYLIGFLSVLSDASEEKPTS